jgi:thiamine pyrophosphate-dependent acetolactate synthase large subunit-like protein
VGRLTAMAKTTGQFILERLADEWGVRRIYGYPGDGINGILGAFHHVGDRLEFTQVLPAFDYAGFARMAGLHGARVERPEDVGAAWDEALAAGRPAVAEGYPAAPRMVRQSLRGKLAEFLTR